MDIKNYKEGMPMQKIKDRSKFKARETSSTLSLSLAAAMLAALAILSLPGFAADYQPGTGHLQGFIYKSDNKTPLWGAQVVLQDSKNLQVFRSNVTDVTGDYQLLDVPVGDYIVHILFRNNSYKIKKVDFLVKIVEGKTTFLSFSLKKSAKGLLAFFDPCCIAAIPPLICLFRCDKEQSPTER
ncbi:MAG: hypothetical protein JSV88_18150 [Candidatus Aminicenantes bacterium]|nr:MAG: hypothetical protein JSV88_18150 [Candidatus Aminicenantes bacterium]